MSAPKTMGRAARLGGAAALAALLGLSFVGQPARAVNGLVSGMWWARADAGTGKPPTVPDGGLWVSSAAASGTEALSALRFTLDEGEDLPKLTLTAAHATPSDGWTIGVCPAAPADWRPTGGSPESMANAPKPDCSGGREVDAPAIKDSSNATILRIEFSAALISTDAEGNRVVNVVLFPKSDSNTEKLAANGAPAPPPTFDATFGRVDGSSLTTVNDGESSGGTANEDAGPIGASSGTAPSFYLPVPDAPSAPPSINIDLGGAPFVGATATTLPPPVAVGGTRPRSVGPTGLVSVVAPKGVTNRQRALLALALVALLAWEFRGVLRGIVGAGGGTGGGAGGRVTLYDLPPDRARDA